MDKERKSVFFGRLKSSFEGCYFSHSISHLKHNKWCIIHEWRHWINATLSIYALSPAVISELRRVKPPQRVLYMQWQCDVSVRASSDSHYFINAQWPQSETQLCSTCGRCPSFRHSSTRTRKCGCVCVHARECVSMRARVCVCMCVCMASACHRRVLMVCSVEDCDRRWFEGDRASAEVSMKESCWTRWALCWMWCLIRNPLLLTTGAATCDWSANWQSQL